MGAEFNINVIENEKWIKLKQNVESKFNITLDEMMVVEGCLNDDKTILGGRRAFMSHFCTFFEFNACHSNHEESAVKKLNTHLNSPDGLDRSINNFLTNLDNDAAESMNPT